MDRSNKSALCQILLVLHILKIDMKNTVSYCRFNLQQTQNGTKV